MTQKIFFSQNFDMGTKEHKYIEESVKNFLPKLLA